MTTAKEIIDSALRRIGVLASGEDATEQEYADCVFALKSLYSNLIAQGTFGQMIDKVVYDDYVVGDNEHVYRSGQYAKKILLPSLRPASTRTNWGDYISEVGINDYVPTDQMPHTEGGLRREVKPPRDCALAFISDETSGETKRMIYDGMSKRWCDLDAIELNTEVPLSGRDDVGMVATLCYLIADEFAKEPTNTMIRQMRSFKSSLAMRRSSEERTVKGQFI